MDSFEKFDASFRDYGSSWKNDITGEQFEKAKEIYDLMECKNFGDYHHLYLTLKVYLLADIFDAFRKVGLKEYRLDPAHLYSVPNFSWEGMLISTEVEIGLLIDIGMLLFCERPIRGGINGTGALRHLKAYNKHMANLDSSKPSVCGAFLMSPPYMPEQCNNLFHWVIINGEQT